MHSLRGMRGLIGGIGFALAALTAMPSPAHAGPDVGDLLAQPIHPVDKRRGVDYTGGILWIG